MPATAWRSFHQSHDSRSLDSRYFFFSCADVTVKYSVIRKNEALLGTIIILNHLNKNVYLFRTLFIPIYPDNRVKRFNQQRGKWRMLWDQIRIEGRDQRVSSSWQNLREISTSQRSMHYRGRVSNQRIPGNGNPSKTENTLLSAVHIAEIKQLQSIVAGTFPRVLPQVSVMER